MCPPCSAKPSEFFYQASAAVDLTERVERHSQIEFGDSALVVGEGRRQMQITRVIIARQRLVQVQLRTGVIARVPAGRPQKPMGDAGFRQRRRALGVAHERLGYLAHLRKIPPDERSDPEAVVGREPLDGILD